MTLPMSPRQLARRNAAVSLVGQSDRGVELTVRGECMRPVLESGDEVKVLRARLLLPGDIVAFASEDGRCLVHRFLGYRRHHGTLAIVTRADQSSKSDVPVASERILGRVRSRRRESAQHEPVKPSLLVRVVCVSVWIRLGLRGLGRTLANRGHR